MNSTRKKHIVITQDDIDSGERGSFDNCPITHAVARAWRHRLPVAVRHEGIFVGETTDQVMWIALLPPKASRFVTAFDKGRRVKPIEFDVVFR